MKIVIRELSDTLAALRARQRLVNVVDGPSLCSFIFPSIVLRWWCLSRQAAVLVRLLREKSEALQPVSPERRVGVSGPFRDRQARLQPHRQAEGFRPAATDLA